MGWGIGNDFNKATGAATPQYAAAANAQGQLDTAEQARIDAIRSGNMTGAAEIGNAYMDSPEMQAGVKGFFGGTPTTAPTMGNGMATGSNMAATAATDAITNEALGTIGGAALETGASELASTAATDAIMSEALGGTASTVAAEAAAAAAAAETAAAAGTVAGTAGTAAGTAGTVAGAGAGAAGGPALMAMMTNPLTAMIAIPAIMAMLKG